MIKIENTVLPSPEQWMAVIRGMRNPMNSWSKSDSYITHIENPDTLNTADFQFFLGENDLALMQKLVSAGTDHAKFLRMIPVMVDIVAPMYWWAEYDTYKVGTVANSCSKMHKIHTKEFTLDDFSYEHLTAECVSLLEKTIVCLNAKRDLYNLGKEKHDWWQMIQLLPSSYNQRRTISLNYAVLQNMYHARKEHKLDEWRDFCKWIETLPYAAELICGEKRN